MLLLYTVAYVCAAVFVVEEFICQVEKRLLPYIIALKDYSS
jgi:hypothetical protein